MKGADGDERRMEEEFAESLPDGVLQRFSSEAKGDDPVAATDVGDASSSWGYLPSFDHYEKRSMNNASSQNGFLSNGSASHQNLNSWTQAYGGGQGSCNANTNFGYSVIWNAADKLLDEQGMVEALRRPQNNAADQHALGTHTPAEFSPTAANLAHSFKFPAPIPLERRGRHNFSLMNSKPNTQEQRSDLLSSNSCCTCKKCECLQLYCYCFGSGSYCGDSCTCVNCLNSRDYEDTVEIARERIQSHKFDAFESKPVVLKDTVNRKGKPTPTRLQRGCNCRKSKCVKKYCECYQADVGCFEECSCKDCKNTYGAKPALVYKVDDDEHLQGLNDVNGQTAVTGLPKLQHPQKSCIIPEYGSNEIRKSCISPEYQSFHNSDNHVDWPGLYSTSPPNVPFFGDLQQNASYEPTCDYPTATGYAFSAGHNGNDPVQSGLYTVQFFK